MADGKIYITISDKRLGEPVEPKPKPEGEGEQNKKKDINSWALHEFIHFMKNEAETMINYTLGHIGYFTGNSMAQQRVDALKQTAGFAKSLVVSVVAGAKIGGAYGAAVSGGIYLATSGINFGLKTATDIIEYGRQNHNINVLRDISGMNSLTNGSR